MTSGFLKKYLNCRSKYRNTKKQQQADDDLCAPAKAINPPHLTGPLLNQHLPTTSAASSVNGDVEDRKSNKKKNKEGVKKSKKTMKMMDANILGFKGAADPNRIVGELESLNNYTHFDE